MIAWRNQKIGTVVIACAMAWFRGGFVYAAGTGLDTLFQYSTEDIDTLRGAKPVGTMTTDRLLYWQEKTFDLVGKNKFSDNDASRVYAYVFVAQRDAAALSWKIHKGYRGNLDGITKDALCVFFPSDCPNMLTDAADEAYSNLLSKVILEKMRQRLEQDKARAKPYPLPKESHAWKKIGLTQGEDTGSWKPWLIRSGSQFRLPPPPKPGSPEDQKQLQAVRAVFSTLTDDQKRAVVTWGGGPGTKRLAGLWLNILAGQIRESEVGFEKALSWLSVMAMAQMDANIAGSDSKYTYWAQRPFMRDSTIQTYLPTPKHPSYPATAAVVAGTSSSLLTLFVPEKRDYWMGLEKEAAGSRSWSGIHFPIDVERGERMGHRIAEAIMKKGVGGKQ